MRPKVGLALGSGGMRGLAHVGVLQVLQREEIPVDFVAGCSIGSLIGALFCSGLCPEHILRVAQTLRKRHWLDFIVPQMGVISGERAYETIRLLTRRRTFDQLPIPLAVVATLLEEGQEYVFTEGDVAGAVRASISVPGIFVPYVQDGKMYVDGAVMNPTPIDVARAMGSDIVIGVDLAHAGTVGAVKNMFDVVIQSIDIMERELFKYRRHFCDILIQPDVAGISPSSFENMDQAARAGELAAEAAVPEIRRLLETRIHSSV